jgi:hypothetical protein
MVRPSDGYSRMNANNKALIGSNNYKELSGGRGGKIFGVDEMRNGKLQREGAGLTRQQNTSAREQYQSALMIRTDAHPILPCLVFAYTFLKYHPPPLRFEICNITVCTVPGKRRTTLHYDWVLSYGPAVALFS